MSFGFKHKQTYPCEVTITFIFKLNLANKLLYRFVMRNCEYIKDNRVAIKISLKHKATESAQGSGHPESKKH